MDDSAVGIRNKRGDWAPTARLDIAPFWHWPLNLRQLGQWLIGYLWPWNAFHMAVTLFYWTVVLPDWAVMKTFGWGWGLTLLLANTVGVTLLYGGVELFYFHRRKQGTRFKFNHRFPSDNRSDVFWFKSQNLDNAARTYLLSIPIWTLVEMVFLWAVANGHGFWVSPDTHFGWLVLLLLLTPAIHEVHFFCIHWVLHQGPLYKWIHSIHHNSINPSPYSSLSMHPVESTLYFADVFWHFLIPSHPLVALFQLNSTAYGALNGHIGFERLELTDKVALHTAAYAHTLHHKYFDVNYGGDGVVPMDKWFGFMHDGSKESDERMKERFRRKKERQQANKPTEGHQP